MLQIVYHDCMYLIHFHGRHSLVDFFYIFRKVWGFSDTDDLKRTSFNDVFCNAVLFAVSSVWLRHLLSFFEFLSYIENLTILSGPSDTFPRSSAENSS